MPEVVVAQVTSAFATSPAAASTTAELMSHRGARSTVLSGRLA